MREGWDEAWNGRNPGSYSYLVDGDANKGHGNDLDGFDEDNPGNSVRPQDDIEFVIVCQHNHADLADYVYIEDGGPPTIVLESDDPGYEKFIGKDKCNKNK